MHGRHCAGETARRLSAGGMGGRFLGGGFGKVVKELGQNGVARLFEPLGKVLGILRPVVGNPGVIAIAGDVVRLGMQEPDAIENSDLE